jgi:glycosyltransferase involved in cell wall biosynthesis
MSQNLPQIAYVSTYVPKRCGLATYTKHLRDAVSKAKGPAAPDLVVAMCDPDEIGHYRDSFFLPLLKNDRDGYRAMAERINQSAADVVSLQHEFGIFGGDQGSWVLDFLEHLTKPVVTTFHTVFEHPTPPYAPVQAEIVRLSDRVHVMNRKAIVHLQDQFQVPPDKIEWIPHGAPVPAAGDRQAIRRRLDWKQRKVLFQFGLLSRSKGIELVLRALAKSVQAVPELLYVIAGQTHPEVLKYEGEAYREELNVLIRELGLGPHVRMIDRYVPEEELVSLLTAADLYVTPYPGMQQITSGTLAYAAGLGRPILSTPYSYAKDLMQGEDGLLLPYGDVDAWSAKLIELFTYPGLLAECERTMAEIGRGMHWPQVGEQHLRMFAKTVARKKWGMVDVV